MEEIIYSRNNNSTISCYSMDFSGISKQNAHGGRNVMPRCLSEGVDIFLKSVEKQGESGHDVRVSQAMRAWLLAHMEGACRRPRHDENHFITFRRKFTPGDATSRRDVPFAVGVRGFTQLSAGYHDQRGTGEKASALRRPLPAAMPRRTQAAWRCRDGPR